MTFDIEKQDASFSHMVIKYTKSYDTVLRSVWFGLYPAFKVFLLTNAMTSSLKSITLLPLVRVIKCSKLYDPEACVSVSILPARNYNLDLWL
jgi:hypothetical protein